EPKRHDVGDADHGLSAPVPPRRRPRATRPDPAGVRSPGRGRPATSKGATRGGRPGERDAVSGPETDLGRGYLGQGGPSQNVGFYGSSSCIPAYGNADAGRAHSPSAPGRPAADEESAQVRTEVVVARVDSWAEEDGFCHAA